MSLGVFLFGYDQGVMSGIITFVLSSVPLLPIHHVRRVLQSLLTRLKRTLFHRLL